MRAVLQHRGVRQRHQLNLSPDGVNLLFATIAFVGFLARSWSRLNDESASLEASIRGVIVTVIFLCHAFIRLSKASDVHNSLLAGVVLIYTGFSIRNALVLKDNYEGGIWIILCWYCLTGFRLLSLIGAHLLILLLLSPFVMNFEVKDIVPAMYAEFGMLLGISFFSLAQLGVQLFIAREVCFCKKHPLMALRHLPADFFDECEFRALSCLDAGISKKQLTREENLCILLRIAQIGDYRTAVLQLLNEMPGDAPELDEHSKMERANVKAAVLQLGAPNQRDPRVSTRRISGSGDNTPPSGRMSWRSNVSTARHAMETESANRKVFRCKTDQRHPSKARVTRPSVSLGAMRSSSMGLQYSKNASNTTGAPQFSEFETSFLNAGSSTALDGSKADCLRRRAVGQSILRRKSTALSPSGHHKAPELNKFHRPSLLARQFPQGQEDLPEVGAVKARRIWVSSDAYTDDYLQFFDNEKRNSKSGASFFAPFLRMWRKLENAERTLLVARWTTVPCVPRQDSFCYFVDRKIERWFLSWSSVLLARMYIARAPMAALSLCVWAAMETWVHIAFFSEPHEARDVANTVLFSLILALRIALPLFVCLALLSRQRLKYFRGPTNSHHFLIRGYSVHLIMLVMSFFDLYLSVVGHYAHNRWLALFCLTFALTPAICHASPFVYTLFTFPYMVIYFTCLLVVNSKARKEVVLVTFALLQAKMLQYFLFFRPSSTNLRLIFCKFVLPYLMYIDGILPSNTDDLIDDESVRSAIITSEASSWTTSAANSSAVGSENNSLHGAAPRRPTSSRPFFV